ncbi:MAG: sterol desaturase family protein [Pseudomonadota bacterium]
MNSPTTRQQAFQSQFRASIAPGYSGVLHAVIIIATGLAALAVCAWNIALPFTLRDLIAIPVVVVVWNFMEWYVHLKVLHVPRKNKIARALYTRHTLTHHQFFTDADPTFKSARDLRIIFFPAFALPVVILLAAPGAFLLGWVLSPNAGWLAIATTVLLYLIFEAFHFCAHLPDNSVVRNIPILNTMRRHHIAHHDQNLMMKYNLNFTLPLADWFFNTSDLNRGLLGTIFNGNSIRHLNHSIRAPAQRPKNDPAEDG